AAASELKSEHSDHFAGGGVGNEFHEQALERFGIGFVALTTRRNARHRWFDPGTCRQHRARARASAQPRFEISKRGQMNVDFVPLVRSETILERDEVA